MDSGDSHWAETDTEKSRVSVPVYYI